MSWHVLIRLVEIARQLNLRFVDYVTFLVEVLAESKTEPLATDSLSNVFLFKMIDYLRHCVSIFDVSPKLAIIIR